jgi:hypothetical protein
VFEQLFAIGEGQVRATVYRPYLNEKARLPGGDLSFLFPQSPFGDFHGFMNALAIASGVITQLVGGAAYEPSYVSWCRSRGILPPRAEPPVSMSFYFSIF